MADEIRAGVYLTATKDETSVTKKAGVTTSTRGEVFSGIEIDWVGTRYVAGVIDVSADDYTLIDLGGVETPGFAYFRNVEASDALMIGRVCGTVLSTPGAPTVSPQGSTGAVVYSYKIVARDAYGRTLAGSAGTTSSGNATLDETNYNEVSWSAVTGATHYDVYGRTAGSELFIARVTAPTVTYDDDGSVETPEGDLPTFNSTGFVPFWYPEGTEPALGKLHGDVVDELAALATPNAAQLEYLILER